MRPTNHYHQELLAHCRSYLENGSLTAIHRYIIANSHLPGPRGNIELAQAFAEVTTGLAETEADRIWGLCLHLKEISADQAPTNDPAELIPFCGAIGIGALGAHFPQFFEASIMELKRLANDPRWRMREGVCFGLQRLLSKRGRETLEHFGQWIAEGTLLELRAVIAAVAEPPLLKDRSFAATALKLQQQVIQRLTMIQQRRSDLFRILRQALGFAISVVVSAIPDPGFEWMFQLSRSDDPDVRWILRQNLTKQRLTKNFPQQVESLRQSLIEPAPNLGQ